MSKIYTFKEQKIMAESSWWKDGCKTQFRIDYNNQKLNYKTYTQTNEEERRDRDEKSYNRVKKNYTAEIKFKKYNLPIPT